MYVYEGFDDAKTKATQVLFQVQIKTKKTKIKKKVKSQFIFIKRVSQ